MVDWRSEFLAKIQPGRWIHAGPAAMAAELVAARAGTLPAINRLRGDGVVLRSAQSVLIARELEARHGRHWGEEGAASKLSDKVPASHQWMLDVLAAVMLVLAAVVLVVRAADWRRG